MTFNTQTDIIRNVSVVLAANIRPVEVAFHTFGYFVKSAVSTVIGLTESLSNPLMLYSVRSIVSFPQVVIFRTVCEAPTLFGAKFRVARRYCHKSFTTSFAFHVVSFSFLMDTITRARTKLVGTLGVSTKFVVTDKAFFKDGIRGSLATLKQRITLLGTKLLLSFKTFNYIKVFLTRLTLYSHTLILTQKYG